MKKIRLQDIAREANVSTATVTRVIRNNGYVSKEKRRLVEEAIIKMGYVAPVSTAQQALPTAHIIGHLVHDTAGNILFARLADAINHAARARGYYVVTINVHDNMPPTEFIKVINELKSYNAAGIIFTSIAEEVDFGSLRHYLSNLPIPIVMMERVANVYGTNKVLVNAREGLLMAAFHLHKQKHRRILYMAPESLNEVEEGRLNGFRAAVDALGIADEAVYLPCVRSGVIYTAENGYLTITEYLKTHELPTAIIASDILLVGVLQYLYEHNVRVPKDISLVATDDTLTGYTVPLLTSTAFPEKEMAETAIELVLNADTKAAPKTISLSPTLIKRDSVAAPRDCRDAEDETA